MGRKAQRTITTIRCCGRWMDWYTRSLWSLDSSAPFPRRWPHSALWLRSLWLWWSICGCSITRPTTRISSQLRWQCAQRCSTRFTFTTWRDYSTHSSMNCRYGLDTFWLLCSYVFWWRMCSFCYSAVPATWTELWNIGRRLKYSSLDFEYSILYTILYTTMYIQMFC